VAAVLRSLGQAEVDSVLAEQGSVTVTCEFCGRPYRFDAVDAISLFAEAAVGEPPASIN
jgi:molecular chaperone Hsp33